VRRAGKIGGDAADESELKSARAHRRFDEDALVRRHRERHGGEGVPLASQPFTVGET